MSRNRQDYEDVMDVKLRWTLKELGFKRKSHATYVHERPKVTRIFELHMDKRGFGFFDLAGVLNHEMEEIVQDVLKSDFEPRDNTRARSHAAASVASLLAIEVKGGPTHPIGAPKFEFEPNVTHMLKFRGDGVWHPRKNPKGVYDNKELDRIFEERVAAFGPYLDEMFRRHVLPWYELCDDPARFARWYEDHMWPSLPKVLGAIIAHHLAANDGRAKELIVERLEEGAKSSEDVLREIQDGAGIRRWMHWPFFRRIFRPEQYEDRARSWCRGQKIAAAEARRLADAFGIAVRAADRVRLT